MRGFIWTILFVVILVCRAPLVQAQEKSLVTTKEVKFEAVVQQIVTEKTIQVHGRASVALRPSERTCARSHVSGAGAYLI